MPGLFYDSEGFLQRADKPAEGWTPADESDADLVKTVYDPSRESVVRENEGPVAYGLKDLADDDQVMTDRELVDFLRKRGEPREGVPTSIAYDDPNAFDMEADVAIGQALAARQPGAAQDPLAHPAEVPFTDLDVALQDRLTPAQDKRLRQEAEEAAYRERAAGPILSPEAITAVQGATRYLGGDFIRAGLDAGETALQGRFPGLKNYDLFQDRALVRENKERNPNAAAMGEIVSVAAPLLLTGGTASAPITMGTGGRAVQIPVLAERVAFKAGEAAAKATGSAVAGTGARLATEGAAYGVLNELDDAFLRSDYSELATKALAGAAWGAAGNIAGSMAVRGLGTVVRRVTKANGDDAIAGQLQQAVRDNAARVEREAAEALDAPAAHSDTIPAPPPAGAQPSTPPVAKALDEMQVIAPPVFVDDYGQRLFGTFTPEALATVQSTADHKQTVSAIRRLTEGKARIDPDELNAFRGDVFRRSYKSLKDIAKLSDEIENRVGIRAKNTHLQANYAAPVQEGLAQGTDEMLPFMSGSGAVNKFRRDAGLESEWIDAMLVNKSAVDEGGASALGLLKRRIEGVIENAFADVDEPTVASVYTSLDSIKRETGKVARRVKNPFVKEALRARYDRLKTVLEDESIWPESLARDQRAINARWTRHIGASMHELLNKLWVQGSEAAVDPFEKLDVPNPSTVANFLRNVGDAEAEPLEAALYDYLDTMIDDQMARARAWGNESLVEKVMELRRTTDKLNYNISVAKSLNLLNAKNAQNVQRSEGLLQRLVGGALSSGVITAATAAGGPAGGLAVGGAIKGGALIKDATRKKRAFSPASLLPGYDDALKTNKAMDKAAESIFERLGQRVKRAQERAPDAAEKSLRIESIEQLQEGVDDLFDDDPEAGPQSRLDSAAEIDPQMVEATAAIINTQRAFIANKVAQAGPPKMRSPMAEQKLAESISTVLSPLRALDRVSAGTAGPETREALQTVWPPLWAEYTQRVSSRPELRDLTYDEKLRLSRQLGVPLDPSLEPARAQALQALASSGAGAGPAQDVLAPSRRREPKMSELYREST